jgi:large subunit ribosomal protein L22
MIAKLKQIRISPKKANLVAALVRKKDVTEAVDTLKFTNKKAAEIIRKMIQSATANAENNFKQNKAELFIKEIIVTEGPTYKRSIPISKGRMNPLLKRTSHITVKLGVKEIPELEEIKAEKAKITESTEEKKDSKKIKDNS